MKDNKIILQFIDENGNYGFYGITSDQLRPIIVKYNTFEQYETLRDSLLNVAELEPISTSHVIDGMLLVADAMEIEDFKELYDSLISLAKIDGKPDEPQQPPTPDDIAKEL